MNRLANSLTEPVRHSMANSPNGVSVSGGLNRAFTNCMNYDQDERPPLSSNLWNQSCAPSMR
jgi:hypothetical protein